MLYKAEVPKKRRHKVSFNERAAFLKRAYSKYRTRASQARAAYGTYAVGKPTAFQKPKLITPYVQTNYRPN